ncbi:hypothetical protein COP2_042177 [Malus domestica]
MLVHQRWQCHLRCDRLVLIGDEGREAVVVDGDAAVGVSGDEGELHGGGDQGRGGDVEAVDGSTDDGELGFVGAVDEPEGEGRDANEEEEDGEAGAQGSVGAAGFVLGHFREVVAGGFFLSVFF